MPGTEPIAQAIEAPPSGDLVVAGALAPANRSASGRFLPGQSGNPTGRPKTATLAALIKERTDDGAELVNFALGVMRSRSQDPRLRLQAMEWLADRGFGRSIQSHEITGEGGGAVVFTLKLGERESE